MSRFETWLVAAVAVLAVYLIMATTGASSEPKPGPTIKARVYALEKRVAALESRTRTIRQELNSFKITVCTKVPVACQVVNP